MQNSLKTPEISAPPPKVKLTPEEQWETDWQDAEDDLKIVQVQNKLNNKHFIRLKDDGIFRFIWSEEQVTHAGFLVQNRQREHFRAKFIKNQDGKLSAELINKKPLLGIPLSTYLANNPNLTLDQRYDLAIKICMKVDSLHKGKYYKNTSERAHRDITTETIFVQPDNRDMHLINLGKIKPQPQLMASKKDIVSQACYEPTNIEQFTLAQKDIFAVMRVLWRDAWYKNQTGEIKHRLKTDSIIFGKSLLQHRTVELLSIYEDTPEGKIISVKQAAEPSIPRDPSKPKPLPSSALDLAANLALLKMKKYTEYDAGVLPMLKADQKEKIVDAGLNYSKESQKEGKDETTLLIENQINIERTLAHKAIEVLRAKNIFIDEEILSPSNWRKELVKLLTNLGIEKARKSGTRNKNKLHYTDVTSGENHELEQAVRVMSHRNNRIRAWSDPTGSTAYNAAEEYFEAAREIANINNTRWQEVLKARSITVQIKTYAQKFPFFSCMKSTEDTIKTNEYRARHTTTV